ncbi:hypothetical protein HMN09_00461400 [Mycena chlorophos]|uniref:C2H2-type domain-containing protein n=1 Tax=Mycena chlorophos TaxID=658473 RepID=A0A8H6TEQ6_MYCCL|nr:hypothetical protein HMN09_00461400 [Mycena chlorophos]
MDRLPTELLARIIELAASAAAVDCELCGRRDSLSEVLVKTELHVLAKLHLLELSRVCSRWHTIVLQTPRLWSQLVIDSVGPRTVGDLEAKKSLLSAVLSRGGNCPLDFEIDEFWLPASDSMTHSRSSECLGLLAAQSHRWRKASLMLESHSASELEGVAGRLPLLEELKLQNDEGAEIPDSVFADAPRLRVFWFTGEARVLPKIPWGQLTTFRFRTYDVPVDFTKIPIDKLPRSCRCNISTEIRAPLPGLPQRISAPVSVFGLSLSPSVSLATEPIRNAEAVGSILGCITLPNVTDLLLHPRGHPQNYPAWHADAFFALATRSGLGQRLRVLSIIVIISDVELVAALRELPALERLIIADLSGSPALVTDSLLAALTQHSTSAAPSTPNLVPNLRLFDFASRLEFSDESLSRFISFATRSRSAELRTQVFVMQAAARKLGDELVKMLKAHERVKLLRSTNSPWHVAYGLGGKPLPEHPLYFKCKDCAYSANRQTELERHSIQHMSDEERDKRMFHCTFAGCTHKTLQQSNLKSHIRAKHTNEKPFACEVSGCEYRSADQPGLVHHRASKHAELYPTVPKQGRKRRTTTAAVEAPLPENPNHLPMLWAPPVASTSQPYSPMPIPPGHRGDFRYSPYYYPPPAAAGTWSPDRYTPSPPSSSTSLYEPSPPNYEMPLPNTVTALSEIPPAIPAARPYSELGQPAAAGFYSLGGGFDAQSISVSPGSTMPQSFDSALQYFPSGYSDSYASASSLSASPTTTSSSGFDFPVSALRYQDQDQNPAFFGVDGPSSDWQLPQPDQTGSYMDSLLGGVPSDGTVAGGSHTPWTFESAHMAQPGMENIWDGSWP